MANSQKESQDLLEAADTLEKDLNQTRNQLDAKDRELKDTRDQMLALEEENARLLETLVRHSKEKAQSVSSGILSGGEIVRASSSQSLIPQQKINMPSGTTSQHQQFA